MASSNKYDKLKSIFSLWKLLTGLFILFSIYFANAETLALASEGTANYRIVSPVSASSAEKFATQELKEYLDQISNANFEIVNEMTDLSIVVGSTASLQKVMPELNIPSLKEEGYGIFRRGENLCLVGGNDRAVLYAVYDLLSNLGCRWIAPNFDFYEGRSQHIPLQQELSFTCESDRIRKPAFKYRKLYIEEGLTHNTQNLLEMIGWMAKARFNILVAPVDYQGHGRVRWDNWREQLIPELQKRGITIEVGGHGYQNFLNADMGNGQLYQDHPEWFGMDKDGNRSTNSHIVFCTSNPNAVEYLQGNLLAYLKARPEIDLFDFWPPDSETWCKCPDCLEMGPAPDRHALLVSQTARLLDKELPEVKLECLAYSRYTKPPQNEILDMNVLLDFCPINQNFEHQIYEESSENNKMYKESLLSWLKLFDGDISIYSYYRKYAWRSLPVIIPHYMQNDLRFYRDCGAKGISVYSEPGDWFTYGLNHYVLGHLAWNPDGDVDSLIKEYCTQLYGPGAEVTVSVYSELENIVRYGCKIPHTKPKTSEKYNEYITRLEACRAEVQAVIDQHSSDRHLPRLELMVEYAIQSASLMKLTSEKNKVEAEITANNIKKLMTENAGKGVFIPR
jgi:hypothetical protein